MSAEFALFCTTPVTLVPITELMVVVLENPVVLELVMLPVLLTAVAPDSVILPVLVAVALRSRLPLPVTPPPKVRVLAIVVRVRSWLFSVTKPLKTLAALLVMVATPVFPDATEIALVKVPARAPFNVALADPLLSPIVIAPVPNAAATVPLSMPDSIVVPPL